MSSLTRQLETVTAQLIRAYDQFDDGNKVKTVSEFHAYGKRWNVDTQALMDEARRNVEKRFGKR